MTQQELLDYLRLVPEAATDPAFYQLMFTGMAPDEAEAKDLSTGNQLVQLGAGALQGAANVGNAFGNLIDPLATMMENKFGTVTANGLFPTVAEARATRDQAKANYDASYGGSIPASIGKDFGLELMGGPLIRAGGAAVNTVPGAQNMLTRLMGASTAGRVAGNALTGAGAGAGYAALESGSLDPTQLATSAAMGAGFSGVRGLDPSTGPVVNMAAKPDGPLPPTGVQRVTQTFEGAPKQAPADQWLGYFRGAQARGLLTKEEQQDIGLDQWLAQKQAAGEPVSREQVAAYVDANVPKVEVVTPAAGGDMHAFNELVTEKAELVADNLIYDKDSWELTQELFPDMPDWDSLDEAGRLKVIHNNAALNDHVTEEGRSLAYGDWDGDDPTEASARYADYQMPGGDNYHERLVVLPTQANKVEGGDFSSYTKAPPSYQSSHWDEPNVLAHWRANERPVGNVPSYHVEEVQSDWHQEGRTQGYMGQHRSSEEIEADMEALRKSAFADKQSMTNEEYSRMSDLRDELADSRKRRVPNAPFKKSWEALTIKQAMKEAVDRGFTRFSWTPGELQSTATGEAKNIKGNDERYNKRLVNIVNDLGKKYGVKVQYQPMNPEAKAVGQWDPMISSRRPSSTVFVVEPAKNTRGEVIGYKVAKNPAQFTGAGQVYDYLNKAKKSELFEVMDVYQTREKAEQVATEFVEKYRPKIPHVDLTPEMINDIKSGKLLSLY